MYASPIFPPPMPTLAAPPWAGRSAWSLQQLTDRHIDAVYARRIGLALLIEHELERRARYGTLDGARTFRHCVHEIDASARDRGRRHD